MSRRFISRYALRIRHAVYNWHTCLQEIKRAPHFICEALFNCFPKFRFIIF